MPDEVTLTDPQRELLLAMHRGGAPEGRTTATKINIARKLADRGLVRYELKFGIARRPVLTDRGRELAEELEQAETPSPAQ